MHDGVTWYSFSKTPILWFACSIVSQGNGVSFSETFLRQLITFEDPQLIVLFSTAAGMMQSSIEMQVSWLIQYPQFLQNKRCLVWSGVGRKSPTTAQRTDSERCRCGIRCLKGDWEGGNLQFLFKWHSFSQVSLVNRCSIIHPLEGTQRKVRIENVWPSFALSSGLQVQAQNRYCKCCILK